MGLLQRIFTDMKIKLLEKWTELRLRHRSLDDLLHFILFDNSLLNILPTEYLTNKSILFAFLNLVGSSLWNYCIAYLM